MQPLSERQKRYIRNAKGIVKPFSASIGPAAKAPPKDREYLTAIRRDWTPPRIRGANGSRIGSSNRLKLDAKRAKREAFFASV